MSDLTDLQAAQTIKVVGSDSSGTETTPVQSTSNGAIHTNLRNNAGTEIGTSTTPLRTDPTGTTTQPISAASLPLPTGAATAALQTQPGVDIGDVTVNNASGAGAVNIQDGGNSITVDAVSLPLPTGASTAANQVTTNSSLSSIDGKLPTTLGQKTTATSLATVNPSEGTNNTTLPTVSTLVAGSDGTNIVPVAVDSQGRLVTSAITGFGADFTFGDVTTAAVTRVLVNRTTYTEQITNGQRSFASSSANDTSAGTGARTLRITYLDQTGAGPFTETITLNGTSRVNTVSTTICFVEQIEVLTAGSGGANAGIITLFTVPTTGGTAIGTIAVGNNQTFWTHHYVPTGKTCNITGISCGHNGTTVGSGALFTLNSKPINVANAVEVQISDFVRLYGQTSTFSRNYASPIKVIGPARIRTFVTPETSTSTVYRSAFDFFQP